MDGHGQDWPRQLTLTLSERPQRPTRAACTVPVPADRAEERLVVHVLAVECPVGCRGTTECLCGQGELSDDPVWIEND